MRMLIYILLCVLRFVALRAGAPEGSLRDLNYMSRVTWWFGRSTKNHTSTWRPASALDDHVIGTAVPPPARDILLAFPPQLVLGFPRVERRVRRQDHALVH